VAGKKNRGRTSAKKRAKPKKTPSEWLRKVSKEVAERDKEILERLS